MLDAALTRNLRALATEEGTTLFVVLLAGFATLLYRYTNQEDILIGTPYHGRSQARFERVVGYLVNTLVIRAVTRPQDSFRTLLRAVHERSREALSHADYPFSLLVSDDLHQPRYPSQTPVCQVMFAFHNLGEQVLRGLHSEVSDVSIPIKFGDASAFLLPLAQQNGQQDLGWIAVDAGDRIDGKLELQHRPVRARDDRADGQSSCRA